MSENNKNMILLAIGICLLLLLITSCGKGVDGAKTVTVVEEKLKCEYNTNVCSSERMTCVRPYYNSMEWSCTLVLEEKVE